MGTTHCGLRTAGHQMASPFCHICKKNIPRLPHKTDERLPFYKNVSFGLILNYLFNVTV
jgi:hypothetical protein